MLPLATLEPGTRARMLGAATPTRRHHARPRRSRTTWLPPALGAALLLSLLAAAASTLAPQAARAATTCTGWASDSAPPPTIRVLRTAGPASGTVQVVPFRDYVGVVMAAEWGPSSPAEALKAGAVAVKEYAWYHAIVWRGGSASGSCYDVVDSSADQIYSPETRTPSASQSSAVDATWGISVRKSGQLFVTHYQGGANVACGANANGWNLYQVSAMNCARAGMAADAILQTYYGPGLEIVGSAPAAGPGAAAAVGFTVQPSGGSAGAPLNGPPTVMIIDSTGRPVTTGTGATLTVTLEFGLNPTGATLNCAGGAGRAAVAGVAVFDGCTISSPGTGYVLVASASGVTATSSVPFDVAPPAPLVSLTASASTIPWSKGVTLAVALVPPASGGVVAGRPVRIQGSIDRSTWTTIASLTTSAGGTATLDYRPATNLYYRAAFDGAPDLGAAMSTDQRVIVRQLALIRPNNPGVVKTLKAGTKITFTTLVRPVGAHLAAAKVRYEVYQKVGPSWTLRSASTVVADSSGQTAFPYVFRAAGSWYVRSMALPTPANANSVWTPVQRYDVR